MANKPAKKAAKKTPAKKTSAKKTPAKKTSTAGKKTPAAKKAAAKKKAAPAKPRQKATGPYASNNPEPRQYIEETAPKPTPAPVEKAEKITEIILEKPSWRARLTGFFKN